MAIVNPREARKNQTLKIETSLGEVTARKLDMTAMFFEGLVPMPLLRAVQKMTGAAIGEDPDPSEIDRLGQLTDAEKADVLLLLRRHAVAAVVAPVVVLEDDGNEDHLPVELFNLMDLMEIWGPTASIPKPKVTPVEAARFRPGATAQPGPAVPDGESVRPEAEPMAEAATADEEFVSR